MRSLGVIQVCREGDGEKAKTMWRQAEIGVSGLKPRNADNHKVEKAKNEYPLQTLEGAYSAHLDFELLLTQTGRD